MPDLFNGNPVPVNIPEGFDLPGWLKNYQPQQLDPIVDSVIKELKGKLGTKRIGGVGYCFGAKYVTRFLKNGQIDVGYVAHPSFVEADELKAIQGPLSISAAGEWCNFPPKMDRTDVGCYAQRPTTFSPPRSAASRRTFSSA